jgi:molybdate transport system permease protein
VTRRPPAALAVAAAIGVAFLCLPLLALLVRAPWRHLVSLVTSSSSLTALRLSLECSLGALALALVTGVPIAYLLARCDFPGRRLLWGVVVVPLVLPPVVGGVALLMAFGRNGIVPLHLAFTTWGAIAAEAFVALPFLVLAVEASLATLDTRYEEVAATLGAPPTRVFRQVTLPLVAPGILAGSALAWARALGEFGATITVAGNFPGRTQTLPIAVYAALQTNFDAALALSVLLLAISLAVLLGLRRRWGPLLR